MSNPTDKTQPFHGLSIALTVNIDSDTAAVAFAESMGVDPATLFDLIASTFQGEAEANMQAIQRTADGSHPRPWAVAASMAPQVVVDYAISTTDRDVWGEMLQAAPGGPETDVNAELEATVRVAEAVAAGKATHHPGLGLRDDSIKVDANGSLNQGLDEVELGKLQLSPEQTQELIELVEALEGLGGFDQAA